MAKPLRSENPAPQNIQFTHFGVLNDGKQSKGAFTTAIVINLVLAGLLVLIGNAVRTVVNSNKPKDIAYVEPVKEPPPPPKPPPPKLPPPPPPKHLDPPKIKPPVEKPLEMKPIEVKMAPQPVHMAPAPPRAVTPPPAPKAVDLSSPVRAAAIANNDAHPSAVRLGNTTSPLSHLTGPAVSPVNLAAGHPGMPATNTGNGPRSATTVSGFGCPTCTDLNGHDRGSQKVVGVKLTAGGDGPLNSKNLTGAPVNVRIQTQAPPPPPPTQTIKTASASAPPRLISKPPLPERTDEAKKLHVEGAVSIRIRVSTSGAVDVLGVARGLGHGLDEVALHAAQGMRFSPALDPSGRPVDWVGIVNVNFQSAG